MTDAVTGKTLISWGFEPGAWFGPALDEANAMWAAGHDDDAIYRRVAELQPDPPVEPRAAPEPFYCALDEDPDDETKCANATRVGETMADVMRTPYVGPGVVMPDACPAGPRGNIPVGGVVASPNIHPGMHSADVCCSVACTEFGAGVEPDDVLDAAQHVTHFGPGPRDRGPAPDWRRWISYDVEREFAHNPFLHDLGAAGVDFMATQGDGNHFLFVGRRAGTGRVCVVTHHGSRKPGAELYRRGMRAADRWRRQIAPDVLKANAWLPGGSREARQYWDALQAVRAWTRANHFCIHELIRQYVDPAYVEDRFWNEHNFVFRGRDGLFYHAKGATPVWDADDMCAGRDPLVSPDRLIPLNMAEPVLVVRSAGRHAPQRALGFAPHGAGRNVSRTEHKRRGLHDLEAETAGVDMRWWTGRPDVGELPSAYKPAQRVRDEIERHGLAHVVDEIRPFGCIMAGETR